MLFLLTMLVQFLDGLAQISYGLGSLGLASFDAVACGTTCAAPVDLDTFAARTLCEMLDDGLHSHAV